MPIANTVPATVSIRGLLNGYKYVDNIDIGMALDLTVF